MPEATLPKFIVVFKDNVTSEQISEYLKTLDDNGGKLNDRWDNTDVKILNGFSAAIPESYFASFQNLTEDVISYIEPDGVVTIQQ